MSGPTASSYETSITVVSYLLLQYITPFIGIGIILYTLVTDDLQFLVVSSFITIPLIAAPLAYWLLEKQWGRTVRPLEFDRQAGDRLSASGVEDRLVPFRLPGADAFDVIRLGKCYVILYSISVVVAVVAETRPLVYVIVASAMGTVILIQSLAATTRTHRWLVLLEAGLFLGNVILTMTMKYHYFVGGTDLILHAEWAHHIVETGHSSEVMDVYEPYPLWHFVIAFVHMVFDGVLSTHRVMVLVSGLLFCLLPTAVYCIVKRIIRDDSISLLSGVFVSLNPIIVYYGMYATPRSIVSVLFAAFLFTCHVRLKWRWFGLLAVLTTALVLFHPASPPFVLAVLCLYGVFISLFHQYEFDFNWSFIAILVLITAFYWIYMTPGVVETFVGILEDSISRWRRCVLGDGQRGVQSVHRCCRPVQQRRVRSVALSYGVRRARGIPVRTNSVLSGVDNRARVDSAVGSRPFVARTRSDHDVEFRPLESVHIYFPRMFQRCWLLRIIGRLGSKGTLLVLLVLLFTIPFFFCWQYLCCW